MNDYNYSTSSDCASDNLTLMAKFYKRTSHTTSTLYFYATCIYFYTTHTKTKFKTNNMYSFKKLHFPFAAASCAASFSALAAAFSAAAMSCAADFAA